MSSQPTAIIYSVTGRRIDLLNFRRQDVSPYDMAAGLSNVCRFAGQVEEFYSVAQHSILVELLVDPVHGLHALTHDGSEAYIGDITHFLKTSFVMDHYRDLEAIVQGRIDEYFDVNVAYSHHQVKAADELAAVFERSVILRREPWAVSRIAEAVEAGYIGSGRFDAMMALAPRLPAVWTPFAPALARRVLGNRLTYHGHIV